MDQLTISEKIFHALRAVLAFLFLVRRDPEIERNVRQLIERLTPFDDWAVSGTTSNYSLKHKTDNIEVNPWYIHEPEDMAIPFRWRTVVKHYCKKVYDVKRSREMQFLYDVLNRKYCYQVELSRYKSDTRIEILDWLRTEFSDIEDGYVYGYLDGWIYIADESIALALKLRFEGTR